MSVVNEKVKHKSFGEGVVIVHEGHRITVAFGEKVKKFAFPEAFDGYLVAQDQELHEQIFHTHIARQQDREREEREKRLELERRRVREIQRKPLVARRERSMRCNVAFKCNYCDGGGSEEQIGFSGVCSDEQIIHNVQIAKHAWCSNGDSDCVQYLEGDITRGELDRIFADGGFVCYENRMLIDWRAYAGVVQTGERKGKPMRLKKVQKNTLCLLTTRYANMTEKDRFIFGVFLVDESHEGDNYEEGSVITHPKYRVKLAPGEAEQLLFWDYMPINHRQRSLFGVRVYTDILMMKRRFRFCRM